MINFDSTAPVKLKGVGDGFWITLDPSQPQDVLKSEIGKIFQNLKHLAVNAGVVIDTGDDSSHDELIEELRSYLIRTFEVGRVTRPPEKRSIPTERIRQRDLSKNWNHHRSDVLMIRGIVRSGQKIESRKHIVILGDANPGSEICSGGDVIVLGRLSGKVHAGFPENDTAMVFALEFKPTLIRIGKTTASGLDEDVRISGEYACVENGAIIVKNYMKAHPFRKMPWPEAI